MSSLRLTDLSFSYGDLPLLANLTTHLTRGWTGIVGPNGGGKTTLLRLLTGALHPTTGALHFDPAAPIIAACPQRVGPLTPAVEAFSWDWSSRAPRLRGLLGLIPESLERWPTLSPGERKRWQIGAALSADPDLLLLDEPTNHLDADARAMLIDALRRFRGLGLVVTHDRELLNALTTATLLLAPGRWRFHGGTYTEARERWRREDTGRLATLEEAQQRQRKARRRLADARRSAESAVARTSTARRMKGPKDSDARGIAAKLRAANGAARRSHQAGLLRRHTERASAAVGDWRPDQQPGRELFIDWEPAPMSRLLTLQRDRLLAGEHPVLSGVDVWLDRTDRVHLTGANGAGKTTLLRALAAAGDLPSERVLLLPQELADGEGLRLLEAVRALDEQPRGRVMQLAAALGLAPGAVLRSEAPSPGEARKLALALGLGQRVWLLLLDEPTNHLDLPSVERLEAALARYPGAMVLVSHDEHFARRCATQRWRLEGGDLHR